MENEMIYDFDDNCCCSTERMFLSKQEKIEALQGYKEYLDKESKGVGEAISTLASK
jgi:hypothetical protein